LGKKKLSKLSDNDELALSKLSKKDRSKAVDGQPDATDERLLNMLFGIYEKETRGGLTRFLNELRLERAFIKNLKDIRTAETFAFSFPADLEEEVRHWWPTLWTEREHARRFIRKYPQFRKG